MQIAWLEIAKARGFESVGGLMRDLYITKGLNIQQCAQRCGCSVHAIREQLLKQGIELRKQGGPRAKPSELNKFTLDELTTLGARAVADKLGLDITTVYKHIRSRSAVQRKPDGIPFRSEEDDPTA